MRIGEAKSPRPQQSGIGSCTDPSCNGAMEKTTIQGACAWRDKPALTLCDRCQVHGATTSSASKCRSKSSMFDSCIFHCIVYPEGQQSPL